MFYSHIFLARKGPLGTVWFAAHMHRRLTKSHCVNTNIPATVEKIMNPEMPIALRMSGHLMFGIVLIYSKKINYIYDEWRNLEVIINKVCEPVPAVDLPADAKQAQHHSITLPETLDLDAIDLDEYHNNLREHTHLKSQVEITLEDSYVTEQFPTGKDPYTVITFDENDLRSSPFAEDNVGTGATPMEEDVPSPVRVNAAAGFNYPSPSNQFGVGQGTVGDGSPLDFPSVEIMRDAVHGFQLGGSPILFDRAEPDKVLEEQIIRDNENGTPVMEEVVFSDGRFPSPLNHQEQNSTEHLNSPTLFAHPSPEMELQPTPPVKPTSPVAAQPKVRRRKRKQFFDESTVLSNEYMKNALNDTRSLCRARRNCPSTSLAIWKQNKRLKKDSALFETSITGSCAELQDLYKEDFVSANPHLVITEEEVHQGASTAQTPLSRNNDDMDIEVLRNNECATPDRFMPSFSVDVPNPNERSCFTPENSNFGSRPELFETAEGDETMPTTDVGASSGYVNSEMETPDTFNREGLNFDHTALSDIPELVTSPGDLGFLEQDDHSPAGSQGTPQFGFSSANQGTPGLPELSSRTRAVAQYLKRQSPMTPISGNSEESSEDLKLNRILEGKSRKICARMFFETLVLKNYDLVDVNQERPYDEITLKVTPKLSKGQF